MNNVAPIRYVQNIEVPGLFICGKKDKLVPMEQVDQLYNSFAGKYKFLCSINKGHNGKRPPDIMSDTVKFLKFILCPEMGKEPGNPRQQLILDTADKSSFSNELDFELPQKVKHNFKKHQKKVGSRRK